MHDGELLRDTLQHAISYLDELDSRPVRPSADPETLRARLSRPLPETGEAADTVIRDLVADTRDGLMGSAGGRFFGWVIGGALPVAVAADWLTSVWDQNAAAVACSPSAAIVEEVAGRWLLDILGLPPTASFGFVTGCQAAHTTAIAAARHSLLAARGWDVEAHGLSGAPPLRLVTGENRHESLMRSVRLLGLGTDSVRLVPCTADGGVDIAQLATVLDADAGRPTIVVLQAGDLNTGTFDDFPAAIALARRHGDWVHVDGAFGLWAAASPRLAPLLDGVAAADSWATDGHKWLNLPFESGFVFVADPTAHSAALAQPTSYSIPVEGVRNPMSWNPEWSRRARGFAVYAALRHLGRSGLADLVERCCDHARAIVDGLAALDGVEVLARPVINQGLVRFRDPARNHDGRTDRAIAEIQRRGRVWFGGTTWRGKRAMRISVCNWRTGTDDVEAAVAAVAEALSA